MLQIRPIRKNNCMTDGVTNAPHRQKQTGIGQYVADHDPLNVTDRKIESPGNGGEGNIYRCI